MKYLITESQYNKAIDMFITYQMEPHEEKKYPDFIYWIKDGKFIAKLEIEKPVEFFLLTDIWNSISNMFSFDYYETQSVIKIWLEEHHNLGRLTPFALGPSLLAKVGRTS